MGIGDQDLGIKEVKIEENPKFEFLNSKQYPNPKPQISNTSVFIALMIVHCLIDWIGVWNYYNLEFV